MAAKRGDVLAFLSEGFCPSCKDLLETRLQHVNLNNNVSLSNGHSNSDSSQDLFWTPNKSTSVSTSTLSSCQGHATNSSPASVTSSRNSVTSALGNLSVNGGNGRASWDDKNRSPSEDQKRMSQVGRKKDFVCYEMVNRKQVNVVEGLELHTRVFNQEEQKNIVDHVYSLQKLGQSGKLRARTYSEPRKWKRGKGRVTIQFGCCYNYAEDKDGNPPGIIRKEEVDPIPSLFKSVIKRMVRWRILPPTCIPNSCIVNIYDEGDCIPPHIDHHDFVRPFCTVSFLTESNILFGSHLKAVDDGEFSGPSSIPLPVGSVLVLKGNGADVAKHCVPAVRGKRISITFRKMDDSKLPFKFTPDPELLGIQPLGSFQVNRLPVQQVPQMHNLHPVNRPSNNDSEVARKTSNSAIQFGEADFPPLGALNLKPRSRKN